MVSLTSISQLVNLGIPLQPEKSKRKWISVTIIMNDDEKSRCERHIVRSDVSRGREKDAI